jgi:hypothetical protein
MTMLRAEEYKRFLRNHFIFATMLYAKLSDGFLFFDFSKLLVNRMQLVLQFILFFEKIHQFFSFDAFRLDILLPALQIK